MKTIALIAVATLGLAACETTRTTTTVIEAPTCQTTQYATLIGQPRSVLSAVTVPAGTRIITPDTAVTMDHNPSRLNIEIDARNRISAVRCG
ncbi:I78 family peptidase inhibitor [Falsirhodobacter xinxiangensis]|uniref:I78 family peptidase inhibitor n=1 Tax=Falsirhodobacter xinxiangensis TaxID=2530049 RepID=UPI0010A9CEFF|nr:I78 family peptidase inhibitor [Rhodobacter xinxiangensis]